MEKEINIVDVFIGIEKFHNSLNVIKSYNEIMVKSLISLINKIKEEDHISFINKAKIHYLALLVIDITKFRNKTNISCMEKMGADIISIMHDYGDGKFSPPLTQSEITKYGWNNGL